MPTFTTSRASMRGVPHRVVPANALGHAQILVRRIDSGLGDSRIMQLCDVYCDTSALAEVSRCCHILIGRWVGSGIVVSIKGGGARRMYGHGQGCLPAAAGQR